MNKPRLLILSDWYLPAVNAGGPVKSVAAIVANLKSHFDISVLTSDRDFGAEAPFPGIAIDSWIPKEGYRVKYCSPANTVSQIQEELQADYDRFYLNSFFSYSFTIAPLRALTKLKKRERVVLAPRGMLGKGAMSLKPLKKKIFIKVAKIKGLYSGIKWHASTELEEQEIKDVFPNAKVCSLRNLSEEKAEHAISLKKEVGELRLVFLSRISPKKNLLYLLKALKQVGHGASLSIYGPIEDEKYWEQCKELMEASTHDIRYKGIAAPSDLPSIFAQYHFFVLPTLNENFGHVILEALNYSCPVLISDQTPWKSLGQFKAGIELSLNNQSNWSVQMDELLSMGNEDYSQWRIGANNLAKKELDQTELIQKYVQLFA